MKLKTWMAVVCAVMGLMACGDKEKQPTKRKGYLNEELRIKGDSTVYGLACEGCNDSTIVLLPTDGRDPVPYDIIDAHRNGRVLGDIQIGDWIGIVVNKQDKHMADEVVNLDELKGIWCYIVMPQMRDYKKMSKKLQQRMMRDMPDSIKQTYLIPREYGFWLRRQWAAQSVGYVSEQSALEQESPVVYPQLSFFTGWHIWNGQLIVESATPVFSKDNTITTINPRKDTCIIVYLGRDSLVLSDGIDSRSYYRKRSINDVNVKARYIAEKLKKEALKKAMRQE
ncbi:hypothetical protein [Segatella maculosa]|uniref:hypothetical protein n=1 Tax=Segatella maculosa TaxID=439703 RepID=UPI0023F03FD2|nr:hypothetical protein [Segatella maculosa]